MQNVNTPLPSLPRSRPSNSPSQLSRTGRDPAPPAPLLGHGLILAGRTARSGPSPDPWGGRDPAVCAGVDEVGRGPLCGAVVTAAVAGMTGKDAQAAVDAAQIAVLNNWLRYIF